LKRWKKTNTLKEIILTNNSLERHIYSETGKTSPLSELPTSSPYIESEMTRDQIDLNKDYQNAESTNNKPSESKFNKEERSKSIVSYESSDLSELDSEAETERMYDGGESQLNKIAKRDESTIVDDEQNEGDEKEGEKTKQDQDQEGQENQEEENDTIIKQEFMDQLDEDKNSDIEVDQGEEGFEKVVEQIKSAEPEEKKESLKQREVEETKDEETNGSIEDNKKRKLSDSKIEPIKKRKTKDQEEETKDQDEDNKDDSQNTPQQLNKLNDKDDVTNQEIEDEAIEEEGDEEDENEGEGEEEEEGDDDDEEEEELTEEQKQQKQEELINELNKQKQRKEAIQYLTEIEIEFAQLRDRLYEDKMSRFKSELEMCLNGSHPELQNVYGKIDSYREDKIKLSTMNQKYKFECIDRKTKATRTSIHQNFFKNKNDFKTKLINDITKEWYKINKERRIMDSIVPEYSYKIPEYVEDLVEQRYLKNQEISILVGLNKYYGFPKAPNLESINNQEMDEDLKAMNITR